MKKPARPNPPTAPTTSTADLDAAKAEAVRILAEAVSRAVDVLMSADLIDKATDQRQVRPQTRRLEKSPAFLEEQEEFITKEEIAKVLGLKDPEMVNRLRRRKKIPGVPYGYRTWRYSIPKVKAALAKREVKEAGADRK